MRGFVSLVSALAVSAFVTASADADPIPTQVLQFSCENGQTVLFSSGTVTNRSHQGFVIGSSGTINSNSIFVIDYLAATGSTGTTVIYSTAPGLIDGPLVTCTAVLASQTILTARGFFTAGGVTPDANTSARLLCQSYGGTFGTGPDLVASGPVMWTCNGWVVPGSDFQSSIDNKISPLAADCAADGGVVLDWSATTPAPVGGNQAWIVDVTCYGPPPAAGSSSAARANSMQVGVIGASGRLDGVAFSAATLFRVPSRAVASRRAAA